MRPLIITSTAFLLPICSSLAYKTPSLPKSTLQMHQPNSIDAATNNHITILGFGSLLSPRSATLTFPALRNFRLGRVPNHRRVFSHPASVFFERGIADLRSLEMSSLSVEWAEGEGFVCSAFEVPNEGLTDGGNEGGWIPSRAFLEREEEFDIVMVPFREMDSSEDDIDERGVPPRTSTSISDSSDLPMGVICRRSTDEAYLSRWGRDHFDKQYARYGIHTIWNWERDSGLKPCPVYMRHCVLASRKCGRECHDSFLDETFLVDRRTTVREYLRRNPRLMDVVPPEELKERYGG